MRFLTILLAVKREISINTRSGFLEIEGAPSIYKEARLEKSWIPMLLEVYTRWGLERRILFCFLKLGSVVSGIRQDLSL